jgi:hypothetical protein
MHTDLTSLDDQDFQDEVTRRLDRLTAAAQAELEAHFSPGALGRAAQQASEKRDAAELATQEVFRELERRKGIRLSRP